MIVPPSALLDGLLSIWPYLLGGVGLALAIGFAVPVSKKKREEAPTKTLIREEIQNDVKIVTKIHKEEVEIPYDVWLKLISDYEKTKQEAQKTVLTQLALLEAKKEEERDKLLRDLTNPDLAYRDLVKVRRLSNGKRKKEEEESEEEVDVDTSELYQA
jgi:hypothetical protein